MSKQGNIFLPIRTLEIILYPTFVADLLAGLSVHSLLLGRAYAVSGRKIAVGLGLGLILTAYTGLGIVKILLYIANGVQTQLQSTPAALTIGIEVEEDISLFHTMLTYCFSEATLSILALISDLAVMSITAYYAWQDTKSFNEVFRYWNRSLLIMFMQQGLLYYLTEIYPVIKDCPCQGIARFIILFMWSLELAVSQKLFPPFLEGFDIELENVVSVTLVCRFMLELRKWSDNPNPSTIPSLNIPTDPAPASSGIRGRLQRINETIIEEFGNRGIVNIEETDMGHEEIGTTGGGINMEICITAKEFPWAINSAESVPGPSGSRNSRL
ncbi:hypothetical protein M422DRAFT_252921 [Sphaerobolus stellatus SS14]|uniref:Uncharacterized protein n=1 Tax=Sphaerobolus stellatus (strain SS14) TaxID=990650 RepID=A0A0C9VYT9_SPHS4|nr:hypothetical protein M422DRAFT_252921 [Sphaerobolus stellatus SS14]